MKKILSLVFCAAFFAAAAAQNAQPRSIKVIGTAEIEIIPDEIHMCIDLMEYTGKDKKKHNIEELEGALINFMNKVVNVDTKEIRYDDMSAYIAYARKRNKDEVITKTYDIKVKSSRQVYLVYAAMDSLSMKKAYVKKYTHSKMDEYKKQVKIDAIKAAQNKAEYLMTAIGSKIGRPLKVTENSGYVTVDEDRVRPFRGNSFSAYSNVSQSYSGTYDDSSGSDGPIVGKTIKVKYEIEAEFEIL